MIKNHQSFKYKNKFFVLMETDSELEPYSFGINGIRVISVKEKMPKQKKQLWIHKFIKAELKRQVKRRVS